MKTILIIASLISIFATNAFAETVKGQTIIASYEALGNCAENSDNSGKLTLAVCSPSKNQEFHFEIFRDIAQQVYWNKIMNGKQCLTGGYKPAFNNLYLANCSISTWSKGAFWNFRTEANITNADNYCIGLDENKMPGAQLIGVNCYGRLFTGFYPAILTKNAKIGVLTLAKYEPSKPIKAIIVDNGYSGANLVASNGAYLKIDVNGNVSATNNGFIIAGGVGGQIAMHTEEKLIREGLGKYLIADYGNTPENLDFFTEKTRGKLDYQPK